MASLSELEWFHYYNTDLCVPADADFRTWLEGIPHHEGTGVDCAAPQSDREILEILYNATDGPNWLNNDNWLTDVPIEEWRGVITNRVGRVTELVLGDNNLNGPIPTELGNLGSLEGLRLSRNDLSGPIPPELGSLANLETLFLGDNELTGAIPPELGNLANLEILSLFDNRLTGPIPPVLGNLANLETLNVFGDELTGTIPAELGNLANLERLSLSRNRLTGPIPPALGNLANLETLNLFGNELTGPIPHSFLQLSQLRSFYMGGNESLCVPGISAFVAWLQRIVNRDGASITCNAADVTALGSLFEAAGGADWTNSAGWLGDPAVEEWHGVSADSLGHVTHLDLSRNGLAGRLTVNLGRLAHLIELRIGDNPNLSGRLPLSLSGLSLRALHYAGTGLCAPVDASYREWLSAVPSHEGTGADCAMLSDREILEALYDATGGPDWTNNDGWLTDASLQDWHGVWVDSDGRVRSLSLTSNALAGAIPPELGGLARLRTLQLTGTYGPTIRARKVGDGLTGPIPPELGNLTELRALSLGSNNLTGPIPPELGNLTELQTLFLGSNNLTGPIPPELGDLAALTRLSLSSNNLTGAIPSRLGRLGNLDYLALSSNDLTGAIPPELGRLSNLRGLILERNDLKDPIPSELGRLVSLEDLDLGRNRLSDRVPAELGNLPQLVRLLLSNNELTGPIPDALGALATLEVLELTNNAGMSGPLPSSLTALGRLEALMAEGTGLCWPANPGVVTWLEGIHKRRIADCAYTEASKAYLIQSAQSREFPVPLVANRQALLRVFPTARETTNEGIPPVRARFYLDGTAVHVVDIPAKAAAIPTEVHEGSLATSANAEVPASVVRPGLEMVVEIDPDATLDVALGVTRRIPETGRMAIDVRTMPTLDLTLVPFLWSERPDSSILDIVEGLSPEDELFRMTRTLLPVGDFDLAVHEPVVTSTNFTSRLFTETGAVWVMEGRRGHYVGTIAGEFTGLRGLGLPGKRVTVTVLGPTIGDPEYVMAHELGHAMSLLHTRCRDTPGQDASYPYPNGSIGVWGYDFRGGGSLVAPHNRDLMSYCGGGIWWISDYHFTNALRYRLADEGSPTGASAATANKSLLLWGGADSEGEPYLEPAFVVDAPPALPDSAGQYAISGRTAGGAELFSISFAMPETDDGDASSSFAFALPVRTGWEDDLAIISLTGPGGSFTLDEDSDIPMVIVRNPRNGQVRGILRDLPPRTQAAMDAVGQAAGPGLEVLFSRGIPEAPAWRR